MNLKSYNINKIIYRLLNRIKFYKKLLFFCNNNFKHKKLKWYLFDCYEIINDFKVVTT